MNLKKAVLTRRTKPRRDPDATPGRADPATWQSGVELAPEQDGEALWIEVIRKMDADLKQAQQRLVSAEKMASLGRLVAGVAHELNNPISFIYGNIHALARYRDRLGSFLAGAEAAGLSPQLQDLWDQLHIGHILDDLDPLLKGTLEWAERVRDLVSDLRRFSSGAQGERVDFDLTPRCTVSLRGMRRAPAGISR